ncbi:MAG: hypothetical protein WC708_04665 [Lentisphaeria bacterium]
MIGSATVTDNFESEYDGHLTPTGTGGTTPIVKPWHAYAWDHSIDVITDPVYVSAHNGNELTREGPTTATLIACWPPTRVSLPSWSTSSTGLAFNPNPGGTTTVTNTSVATGQPVTVTAQATQQAPFSGPLSATATVNVMDVDIAAATVAEKDETTTAVLVPVLTMTATSGGVPVSLSVAPTMGGTAKLEKSSSSFDVYSDATLSSSSALLSGTQTTATFASASSIPPTVYLKGITASTSTASSDTLTLSFTPSAQTGGNTPPEFKDKVKVSVISVNVAFSDPDASDWVELEEKKVILSDKDTRIKVVITPSISDLQTILNLLGTSLKIVTSETATNGQIYTLTTQNTTLIQGSGYSEMRISLTRNQLKTLGVLPSQEADSVSEKAWLDHGSNNSSDASNLTDGEAFDSGLTAATRGQSTNYGTLSSTPTNSPVDKTFFVAAGREIITAEYGNTTSQKRQIMNQADYFYYSGHGFHSNATLQGGFGPSDVANYWNKDLDCVILAGCSVLDIKDYRAPYLSQYQWTRWYLKGGGAWSPGAQWESTGPKYLLGYNWKAPLDNQGSAGIISTFSAAVNGGASVIDAWRQANDLGIGRNACAIDINSNPHVYWYWDEASGTPVWTSVVKSGGSW